MDLRDTVDALLAVDSDDSDRFADRLGLQRPADAIEAARSDGGLGLFAALAYRAYRRAHSDQQRRYGLGDFTPTPTREGALHDALIIAMVSAVRADGAVDPDDRIVLYRCVREYGLKASHRLLIDQVLLWTTEPSKVAALAETDPMRAQVYLASLALIGGRSPHELRYLEGLRETLGLSDRWYQELARSADAIRHIFRQVPLHEAQPVVEPFAAMLIEPDVVQDRTQPRV